MLHRAENQNKRTASGSILLLPKKTSISSVLVLPSAMRPIHTPFKWCLGGTTRQVAKIFASFAAAECVVTTPRPSPEIA